MQVIQFCQGVWIWYASYCRRLGIHPFGPLGIFLIASLFFAFSKIMAEPCIPKDGPARTAAIKLKKEVQILQENDAPSLFSLDFCALQWKLFLKSLDKPHR